MNKRRIGNICLSVLLVVAIGIGIFQHSGVNWGSVLSGGMKNPLLNLVRPDAKVVINDLSKAFDIILENSPREFYKGYPIDESFLHWVSNRFGDDAIMDIAYRLYEGYVDEELWYTYTDNSMHVLWLMYCKELGFSTYQLEHVHWQECADETVVTIDLTGDINLADDWHTMQVAITKPNGIYDCISEEIVKELQAADISVINNEFVFSDGGERQENKAYTFRAKTANISFLNAFGADLANLANNHTYDFKASGLMDTIATLNGYGIATMGAGTNLAEAKTIQYYIANGKKIAFVSATEIEKYYRFTKEATETEPGVLKTLDPTIFNQVIAEAKANSDYVIVSVHWGTEGTYKYNTSQYNLAKGFVDAGADAVIGGHPHRLQGIEYIDNVPVCYSLGNFWFSTGTLYTTIAQVQIDDEGELALRMLPCIQQDLGTYMLSGEEADRFYKFMADISKNIVIDKNGFVYNTSNGANAYLENDAYYQSGMNYGSYNGNQDLEGRAIDIVGNLQ
ncbi:MAG: CapA family protein [Agathobacter sp.]|nr:CapA family protein [Agathobacter sp.]